MFGLLLRTDQETAKRAIISGDRGRKKNGRGIDRGGKRSVAGLVAMSKVFAILWGWKDHTTPLMLSYPLSHCFSSDVCVCMCVLAYTHSYKHKYTPHTNNGYESVSAMTSTTTSHVSVTLWYFQMGSGCSRKRSHPFHDRGRTRSLLIVFSGEFQMRMRSYVLLVLLGNLVHFYNSAFSLSLSSLASRCVAAMTVCRHF